MTRLTKTMCSVGVWALAVALPVTASAQATRTWVSGVGDDVNPCSRTAPCKTWAGAISKTANRGEISALDPGGFGAITITKSITINGDGTLAAILAAGTNGVIINATNADTVVLRNISINGGGTGINGIRYLAAGSVVLENVYINGFTQKNVDIALTNSGTFTMKNSTLIGGQAGISATTTAGTLKLAIDQAVIRGMTQNGIVTLVGGGGTVNTVTVINSVLAQNVVGVQSNFGAISVEHSLFSGNTTGANATLGSSLRLADNGFYDNTTPYACSGGATIVTDGNNRTAPPPTVPGCMTATLSKQ